jgi:hypothetical protein
MGEKKKMSNTVLIGHIRKRIILVLMLGWMICYFIYLEKIDNIASFVLCALVVLYIFDHLYSIILSAKASEFFKSFMFQTAVPITALGIVAFLSYSESIDSQATITLFGLSLGYTTFVVGKRLKKEPQNETENSEDEQDEPNKANSADARTSGG